LTTLGLFLPDWALPWVAVGAVAAWILGLRGIGVSLAVLFVADTVLAPFLEPWLDTVPPWALVAGLVIVTLLVLQGFVVALFGREAWGHFAGTWLVRLGDLLLLGPFRALGAILRWGGPGR
jgi:hypothetical protein